MLADHIAGEVNPGCRGFFFYAGIFMVGDTGLEPVTSAM